jgi:hypothetical protein
VLSDVVNAVMTYNVSAALHCSMHASLMDHSANGGVAREDVCIILYTIHSMDIQGLNNHQVMNILIVTAGGVIQLQHGPMIAILHQYASIRHGCTIHSLAQLEWYQNNVNDHSVKVQGRLQQITMLNGYMFPINIINGLPYVTMHP